jgi:hypothetical protein
MFEEAALVKHAFTLDLYKGLRDPVLVRYQFPYVLLAGTDMTVCLMSWAFFPRVPHEALENLRSEVQLVTGGSFESSRPKINKMRSCFKSMRVMASPS